MDTPPGVGTDSSGDVLVADYYNDRVDEFTASGEFARAWGWGVADGQSKLEVCTTSCYAGLAGGGTGQLNHPSAVAGDSSGDVFVTDDGNYRIDEFGADGAFMRAWGWGVTDGQSQLEVCTSSCQPGLQGGGDGQLYDPSGIAVHDSGDVFVTDDDFVDEFTPQGAFVRSWSYAGPDGSLLAPVGVAVDGTGDVFVSDGGNQRIVEFTSVGAFVRAWGWGVTDGQSKLEVCTSICRAGLSGGGAGQFNTPWGLAVDASGDVFVADELNERVDEFSSAGEFVRAWGWGVASGQSAFEVCTNSCRAGLLGRGSYQLYYPTGVAADASSDVFVTDNANNRIDEFSSAR